MNFFFPAKFRRLSVGVRVRSNTPYTHTHVRMNLHSLEFRLIEVPPCARARACVCRSGKTRGKEGGETARKSTRGTIGLYARHVDRRRRYCATRSSTPPAPRRPCTGAFRKQRSFRRFITRRPNVNRPAGGGGGRGPLKVSEGKEKGIIRRLVRRTRVVGAKSIIYKKKNTRSRIGGGESRATERSACVRKQVWGEGSDRFIDVFFYFYSLRICGTRSNGQNDVRYLSIPVNI